MGRYHRPRSRVRAGRPAEIYHAVDQQDYLAIVARTPSGHFPIVRQYRPALESFTWELPAGLAEPDEDPAEGCRRELLEETGYPTRAIHPLERRPRAPAASATAFIRSFWKPASASTTSCPSRGSPSGW